jgi:protein gp37
MSGKSAIEWTDATWNPIVGCSIVSPGCTNCYAMKLAGSRLAHTMKYRGLTKDSNAGPVWTGEVRLWEKALTDPLHWREPRKIFVNSEGDLFHESIPDEWTDRVFAVMALCPQHTFQVLTKRAERMRDYFATPRRADTINGRIWSTLGTPIGSRIQHFGKWLITLPLPNVWLGVSCERQQEADERIPLLLQTPAAVRFISAEPLLGPIDLTVFRREPSEIDLQLSAREHVRDYWFDALKGTRGVLMHDGRSLEVPEEIDRHARLDWVIVGGESGPHARPMHPQWARDIRDQCAAAGVPFFFKQWGEHLPVGQSLPGYGTVHGATAVKPGRMKLHYGGTPTQAPKHAFAENGVAFTSAADGRLAFRVGKKAAGRLLDGVEHNDFPEARS